MPEKTDFMDSILYFDGYCHLCSRSVDFIIRHDPEKRLKFAALQRAGHLLPRQNFGKEEPGSVILFHRGKYYFRSTAVLKVAGMLRPPWSFAVILLAVPRPLRDLCYRFIARKRFQWFGRRKTCKVPGEGETDRFIL